MKALRFYLAWIPCSIIIGVLGGVVGSTFSHATLFVTSLRLNNPRFLFLLPIGGALVFLLYHLSHYDKNGGANQIVKALNYDEDIPLRMFPLSFTSAVFSHLCGASIGRVGTTIQLGGSMANALSKLFRLSKINRNTLIVCGVSSVFSGLFGTPLAGAFWGVELAGFGTYFYYALPMSFISSFTARYVGIKLGLPNAKFSVLNFPGLDIKSIGIVMLFAAISGVCAILYCLMIFDYRYKIESFLKNNYVRGVLFGSIILVLTIYLNKWGYQSYNGMGKDVIEQAFLGNTIPIAFLLKIIFTSLSFTAGYKGGEVYPAVFIGATLGCAFGNIVGFYPSFLAALGVGGIFCAITKCPLASLFLCMELFSTKGAFFYIVTILISYIVSIKYGLYNSQKKLKMGA